VIRKVSNPYIIPFERNKKEKLKNLRGCMCQGAQFILSHGAKHVAFKTMMISNVVGIDGTLVEKRDFVGSCPEL
jgi:hypothetical protein